MVFDSNFFRRLKLYLFGFLIGALAVNVIFKGKACRLPGTVKLEELQVQKREYTPNVLCKMTCNKIDTADVSQFLLQGKINYDKSDVRAQPFPTFFIEGSLKGQATGMTLTDCDTISKIILIINSGKDTCNCK